ncbi:hypothetical protein M011DRAFT_102586 [Sporormia fimetaria CBS 119925]|uniref:Uncharacterized protein n=1 Tax=Sporormia fimetaria CBS 119925 TaxID=1340428 RepID=A0A6A6VKJ6_9PLEO|nr:hypothetical protein M011DRAFT_102586 [Sporormia fimetaria CBS 119925]
MDSLPLHASIFPSPNPCPSFFFLLPFAKRTLPIPILLTMTKPSMTPTHPTQPSTGTLLQRPALHTRSTSTPTWHLHNARDTLLRERKARKKCKCAPEKSKSKSASKTNESSKAVETSKPKSTVSSKPKSNKFDPESKPKRKWERGKRHSGSKAREEWMRKLLVGEVGGKSRCTGGVVKTSRLRVQEVCEDGVESEDSMEWEMSRSAKVERRATLLRVEAERYGGYKDVRK